MESRKKSFVLVTFEGGGSVAPFITLARQLLARGHHVRIVSDACNEDEALAAGAMFSPWARAISRPVRGREHEPVRDWEAADGFAGICMMLDVAVVGRAEDYARDMIAILRAHPADLVIVNDLILGAMAGCEALGQPFAVMSCNPLAFPLVEDMVPLGPGLPPAVTPEEKALHATVREGIMATFDTRLPLYNTQRASLGLPPLPHLAHQVLAARRFIMATSPALDFAPARLPEFFTYVGPLLGDNLWSRPWVSPFAAEDQRPLVLVSFSTTFQNQGAGLQRVVDALAGLEVRAVVTLGGAIRLDEVRAAHNVHVVESAPHGLLLREASLVINHGGHGTVAKSAMAGLPQLVIPHGRDQGDNAVRITWRGAGLSLQPGSDVATIREAVRRLLGEPGFGDAARALGARMQADHDPQAIVREAESLAAGADERARVA